jgi:hypothetical protein
LNTALISDLEDAKAYYIYAKCEIDAPSEDPEAPPVPSLDGMLILSEEQIRVKQVLNYYHFLIGDLSSVIDGARIISLTYGSTTINGKFIRTGEISSSDESCVIDLDGNKITFGDANSELSWNKNGDRKLRLKGTLVQSESGDESPIGVYRGIYNPSYIYYKGDEVTYGGSTWQYINDTAGSGHTPTEGAYWHVMAAKGDPGYNGEPGVPGVDGQTSYFHIKYAPVQNPTAGQMSETPNLYIGTYVDFTQADSTSPASYTWSRFQGFDGNQGIPGTNGTNGQTSYFHIAYADDANGGGFSQSSAGKKYMGTYVDFTAADSSNPADYNWVLITTQIGENLILNSKINYSGTAHYGDLVISKQIEQGKTYTISARVQSPTGGSLQLIVKHPTDWSYEEKRFSIWTDSLF